MPHRIFTRGLVAPLAGILTLGVPSRAHADGAHPYFTLASELAGNILGLFIVIFIVAAAARLLLLLVRKAVGARVIAREVTPGADAPQEVRPRSLTIFGFRPRVWGAFLVAAGIGSIFFQVWHQRSQQQRWAYSEARSNLGAIRSTQVAYFAEWGVYIGGQPLTPVADRRHRAEKVAWDPNTRFSILGFAPEGYVRFSYELEGPAWSREGFTARAQGDIDNDGRREIFTITNTSYEVVRADER